MRRTTESIKKTKPIAQHRLDVDFGLLNCATARPAEHAYLTVKPTPFDFNNTV